MAAQVVVGLYESKGYAQDARNRLHTEGLPEADMMLVVLHEIDPVPSTLQSELAALSVDPLILGDVEKSFARFIRNGETALLVRAASDADVQFASEVMALFAPLAIEVLPWRPTQPQQ
jgi:hypothetical protein